MANVYSGILNGTMDAFASIISNNMNIVMKVLGDHYHCHEYSDHCVQCLRNECGWFRYAFIKESIGISDHYPDFCGDQCCGSDHSFQKAIFLIFKSFLKGDFNEIY